VNKIRNEKKALILLFVFFIIQPLLDIYILFSEKVVNILSFSPSTIIRIIFVVFFVIITLIQYKFNFRKEKYILIYLVAVGAYFIFHHYNCLQLRTDLPGTFRYSAITEIFYFIRMLIPFTLIYVLYKQKFKKEYFYKIINIVVLAFSLIIIVTNIFKISLASYGGDRIIADSIFGWFTEDGRSNGHELLASRGFFTSANQISALLLMLLTITFYKMIKEPSKLNISVVVLQILAMIMIGTRVASYGWIAVIALVFICYLFFCCIKKGIKFNKMVLMIMAILAIPITTIQIYSPILVRVYDSYVEPSVGEETGLEEGLGEETKEGQGEETKPKPPIDMNSAKEKLNSYLEDLDEETFVLTEEIEEFFEESYMYFGINPGYIMRDLYSYKTDPVFWLQTMALDYSQVAGNRNHDLLITRRIFGLNNNENDKLLGIGFSTLRNGKIYIEQDFRVHRYSIGTAGIILLLGPYFIILFKSLFAILTNYRKKFNMETIIFMLAISLAIIVSLLSGHVMDELIVTTFIALISAMLLLNINEKEDENAED